MTLKWSVLGEIEYSRAVRLMETLRERVLSCQGESSWLLLGWHPPVVTMGRHAKRDHLLVEPSRLASQGIDFCESTRGGDVTYHDRGQLMIYPIMRIRSVRRFIADIAEAICRTAEAFGVVGARWKEDPAGVWFGDKKLAACGLHIHRGVTNHGFALNLGSPGPTWDAIVPCGLAQSRPIGIQDITARRPSRIDVARQVAAEIGAMNASNGHGPLAEVDAQVILDASS